MGRFPVKHKRSFTRQLLIAYRWNLKQGVILFQNVQTFPGAVWCLLRRDSLPAERRSACELLAPYFKKPLTFPRWRLVKKILENHVQQKNRRLPDDEAKWTLEDEVRWCVILALPVAVKKIDVWQPLSWRRTIKSALNKQIPSDLLGLDCQRQQEVQLSDEEIDRQQAAGLHKTALRVSKTERVRCRVCNGQGTVSNQSCWRCHGAGKISRLKTVKPGPNELSFASNQGLIKSFGSTGAGEAPISRFPGKPSLSTIFELLKSGEMTDQADISTAITEICRSVGVSEVDETLLRRREAGASSMELAQEFGLTPAAVRQRQNREFKKLAAAVADVVTKTTTGRM